MSMADTASANVDFNAIRAGLASLPRTENHTPGQAVPPDVVYTPFGHRNALDPERTLVVGNRGVGKSFWAHALLDAKIRQHAAQFYRQPILNSTKVVIGFNASERTDEIAPPLSVIRQALQSGIDAETTWRAVLARAVAGFINEKGSPLPRSFVDLARWVSDDPERYANLMTEADTAVSDQKKKLLVIFDALDLLGANWPEKQQLTRALLSRALSAKSYRAIRLKLFMRPDQYTDPGLFTFPDASKIKNDRVDLAWSSEDLYGLLFQRLQLSPDSSEAFRRLIIELGHVQRVATGSQFAFDVRSSDDQKSIVNAIAGEFMGSGAKRGRVYTWLPTHLGDAVGETSPRTFLTAWQVAAQHNPAPVGRAVDYLGLSEGVRRASEDRLNELQQDYPWIRIVLRPLAGESVPMLWTKLESIWRQHQTVHAILSETEKQGWLGPISLVQSKGSPDESALLETLQAIGVIEMRANAKVNVPDIFRVEARIKRKGGVKPPRGRGS